jgi:hypothetical protein
MQAMSRPVTAGIQCAPFPADAAAFDKEGYVSLDASGVLAYFGEHIHDPAWDRFLERSPAGEFQQSSMWAKVKSEEGWRVARVIIVRSGIIEGGFQILWKKVRVGRIGYLARGPVLFGGPQVCAHAVRLLKRAAGKLRLSALIVQGPVHDAVMDGVLKDAGFLPNRFQRIITATWLIPLEGGITAVEAGMRKSTRNTFRQALRRGVTVREGGREDLSVFFDLMVATCRRQSVTPSPSSLDGIRAVWEAFSPGGHARLTFAMHEGRTVSGVFCLCFGTKVYIWKKGSLADALPVHPMEPLYHEILAWSHARGFRAVDHCGVGRKTAEIVLRNEPLTEEIKGSRDFYHMGFGGRPELLPLASIWIRNPLLRTHYRIGACNPISERALRKRCEC